MKTITIIKGLSFVLACCMVLLISGCDDFVDTDQPNSQLTTDAVFEDPTTANAAMTDIYAQMRENGLVSGNIFGISTLLGVYSDEFISYDNGSYATTDFYNNSVLASNALVATLWNSSYNQIYAANLVNEGVGNSTSLAQDDRDHLQGEALFVRAFIHFNLLNIFGDIPYVTTTDFAANSTVSRMPAENVYESIIADLESAVTLLPVSYLTPERIRPNRGAAQALLARVYLYHGDYAEAANMASAVLNDNANYIWVEDQDAIFLKESTATIWQLSPGAEGANTNEGSNFIFHAGPPTRVALTEAFVSGFEAGDLRRLHWIREITEGTASWFHPFKYKQDTSTGSSVEYSIVFRLAEQYLIRAEARAIQGDLIGAKEDLNKIRQTAGLLDTPAITQAEIIEAVLIERQHELFTEQGHRFFDLKRLGKLNEALISKPGWNATDRLWPIPQTELQVNPLLNPQNAGY